MYGANAPKLTRLIIEEIRKESEKAAGTPRTDEREITELADEEQVRVDEANAKVEAARLVEEQKKAQQLRDRRMDQAKLILETYGHIGVILILQQGKPYFTELMADLWPLAGLNLNSKEKIKMTPEMLEEILYFEPDFVIPEHIEEVFVSLTLFNLFV